MYDLSYKVYVLNFLCPEFFAKKDEDFNWLDYKILFGPYAPAGTYEEVVYFLSNVFIYLRTNDDVDTLELISHLVWFCSEFLDKLEEDGLSDFVKFEISECLDQWIKDFKIIHFNKKACESKGWKRDHFDLVHHMEAICETTSDLIRFKSLKCVSCSFFESLAQFNDDKIKASWFLELSRARFEICPPPDVIEITTILNNKQLLNEAYNLVWSDVLNESDSTTYWKDTFNQLKI